MQQQTRVEGFGTRNVVAQPSPSADTSGNYFDMDFMSLVVSYQPQTREDNSLNTHRMVLIAEVDVTERSTPPESASTLP